MIPEAQRGTGKPLDYTDRRPVAQPPDLKSGLLFQNKGYDLLIAGTFS